MAGVRFLAVALAGGFALAGGAQRALAAEPVTLRPTTGGDYAYTVPEAPPYVGARAVVHYVRSGADAPPLNDDDTDGSPDYVEQASVAADTALLYFEQHGLKRPLPDARGPTRSRMSTSTPFPPASSA